MHLPDLILLLLGAPFVGLFGWSLVRLIRRQRTRTWPVVSGTVVGDEFLPGMASSYQRIPPQYQLEYRYEVSGTAYVTKEIVPQDYLVRSGGFSRKLGSLRAGEAVPVHVNPADATQSTVAPGAWEAGAGPVLFMSGTMSLALLWSVLHFG